MPTEPGAQKAPQKNYVDTKIIATLFGLTARRIQQLTQDGILETEQVGRQRRYDLLDTVRRYIAYLQENATVKAAAKTTPRTRAGRSRPTLTSKQRKQRSPTWSSKS